MQKPDAIIVGGGAVGYAAALALAGESLDVTLIAGEQKPQRDGRSIAIMERGLALLERLGLGDILPDTGTPLAGIRIIDATNSLFRSPPVTFHAHEIGRDYFGRSIEAATLVGLLRSKAEAKGIAILDRTVESVALGGKEAALRLSDGTEISAPVVIGADGARSAIREAAGIATRAWSYPQVALSFIVSHSRDHQDISTEFHTRQGPFTLVPNGASECSVVWMVEPQRAEALLALDAAQFCLEAEAQCRSMLGKFRLVGERTAFPMRGLLARAIAGERVALAGEAAHVFPPIGAQGLNLGLRDVEALAKILGAARRAGEDVGAAAVLARYAGARRLDLVSRTAVIDLVNRMLLSHWLPVDFLRGAGLSLLGAIGPLRRLTMRLGMGGDALPAFAPPFLKRPASVETAG